MPHHPDTTLAAELIGQATQIGQAGIDQNHAVRQQLWQGLLTLYADEIRREGGQPIMAVRRLLDDQPQQVWAMLHLAGPFGPVSGR